MGKYKYLLKNMGILTLSNFATKLLQFFLVPLYTNILTTAEYGTYDLFSTTVSLLVPILTLDIQESVMRFSLDKDKDESNIFTVGIRHALVSVVLVIAGVVVNAVLGISDSLTEYAVMFVLLYAVTSISGIFNYFARGMEKIAAISISSVLSSATVIALNILFLVVFKWGITGYFLAYIIGPMVSMCFLFFKLKLWRYWKPRSVKMELNKEMRRYSTPLIANAVSWWVNNASDRYVITWIMGVATNGVYSVAYKIPSIISMFQNIFGQAWTISAVVDYDEDDKSGFFTNTYTMYNTAMVLICSVLIAGDKVIAKLLFAKDFYSAWKYVPFLLIGTMFSGMSSYFGGILSALKKTGTFATTSTITAVINLCLNILLVWRIGAQGAAIATAFSYFVMWLLRYREVRKHTKLNIHNIKNAFMYLILVAQAVSLIMSEGERLIDVSQILFFIVIVLLNLDVMKKYGKKIIVKMRS